jgi:CDP-diacylglycerol--serine O-phosphatidyltransferase
MQIRKHIPNAITCLNLVAGSFAVYCAIIADYRSALIAVLIAGLFDFLDGMAARVLKAYSPMGKELDSLADMVSFGLLPGMLAFSLLFNSEWLYWTRYAGFILPVFSALRLAKFNIDERQTSSFIGLPTPSNAIFWAGAAYAYEVQLIQNPWLVLLLIVLFSYLLISPLPMFSLKFSNMRWSDNKLQFIFLGGCVALLLWLGIGAFAPIILWYIGCSMFAVIKPKQS